MQGWKEVTLKEFAALVGRHGSRGFEHSREDGKHIVHQNEGRPFAIQVVDLDGNSKCYVPEDPPVQALLDDEDSGGTPPPPTPPVRP